MKLRFRFIIFFSLLFSLLMICAALLIFILFEKARERDFNRRLWAQAYASYSDFYRTTLPDSVQEIVKGYHSNTISQLQVIIANDKGEVQYKLKAKSAAIPSLSLLQNIRQKTLVYDTKDSNYQQAALYIKAPQPAFIISSGYDKSGWTRVKNLQHILSMVALIGICFIIGLAIIISNLVTRPLIRLGLQIQRISENNLKERIEIRPGRLNHEETQIAIHFNAMLDRLASAFELQKSFVHHASHELRTPLAAMLLHTELALSKNLTVEEARKVLETLKEDQQEMVELTNSLLLLSKYETSKTSQEWPVLRLDELLYETMGMVKRLLPNVNVSLEFAQVPENELFLSIQGNDSLIRSAFRNLIKNAWLYSDNKSVAVTIDATATDIFLHFDNNGKLLSLEEQERLFVPFFRASNSASKKGFGLGLNIIQRIVAMHKGSVGYIIYNNLNRFTLQFPKLSSAALIL